MKPDCYKCVFRRSILDNAHSRCEAPAGTHVVGNSLGVRSGWFFWPYNFDPVWLKECDGFTPKQDAACEKEEK